MSDHCLGPKGVVCKCGAPKLETEFFCASCTAKLPERLAQRFHECRTHSHLRELIRRAVRVLDLPPTRHQTHF